VGAVTELPAALATPKFANAKIDVVIMDAPTIIENFFLFNFIFCCSP
jgi:hypothetical protein